MQVTLPISAQTPASEAPAIQSSEKSNESSASTFWDHMGQILNQNNENCSDQDAEKIAERMPMATRNNPQRLHPNVSAHSAKSTQTETSTDLNESDSALSSIQNGDGAYSNMALSNGEANPDSESKTSVATGTEERSGTISVSGIEAVENTQKTTNPPAESPSSVLDSIPDDNPELRAFKTASQADRMIPSSPQAMAEPSAAEDTGADFSGAILQSSSNAVSERINPADNLGISQNANTQIKNLPDSVAAEKVQDYASAWNAVKTLQSKPGDTQLGASVSQDMPGESPKGAVRPSGSSAAPESVDFAGKPRMRQDAKIQVGNSPASILPEKAKDIAYVLNEARSSQHNTNDTQLDPSASQAPSVDSTEESFQQSGSSSASEKAGLPGKLGILPDANAQIEGVSASVPAEKAQNIACALHEKAILGDAQLGVSIFQAKAESIKGAVPQSGSTIVSEKIDLSGRFGMLRDPNAQVENVSASVSSIKAQDSASVWYGERILQGKPDIAQLGTSFLHAMPLESRKGSAPQSGLNTVYDAINLSAKQFIWQDSNKESETLPTAVSPQNMEDIAAAALETMGFGDSYADQKSSRDTSAPWMALQPKLETSQLNSAKPSSSAAGDPQGTISAPLPLEAARELNSSSLIRSASEPASTTQSKEFILQVAERIQFQMREGKETVRIQLKPDSLGRIEIKAENTASGMVARIVTESSNVKSYLENNLHILQQTLQEQGLKIDRIHIVVSDSLDSSSFSGQNAHFNHAGSGHSESESYGSPGLSGSMTTNPLEEISLDPTTWISLNPNIRFHTVA
jgi:flagellar hook-length control protein FliK